MAGQRLLLPAVGMAMAAVIAGLDLGRRPSQAEQDRRILEEQPGRGIEARFPHEGQGGQGAEQQRVVEAGALPAGRQRVEGLEDAQLDVQGEQFVERSGGHRRGHQRAVLAAQPLQDGRLVLTKPLQRHDAPPGVRRILRAQTLISNCLPRRHLSPSHRGG